MPYKIGSILREYNLISDKDIERVSEYQRKFGFKFGESLISLNLSKDEEINFALHKQLELKNNLKKKGFHLAELKYLFKLLASYRLYVILILFYSILSSIIADAVIGAFLVGFIVNHVIPSKNLDLLLLACAGAAGAFTIGRILAYFSTITLLMFKAKLFSKLQDVVFSHIASLPYIFFSKFEKGDLINRITSNLEHCVELLINMIGGFFSNIFLFVYITVILIIFSPSLTLLCFLMIILVLVMPALIMNMANRQIHKEREIIGNISSFVREMFENYRYILLNSKQENFKKVFNEKLGEYYKTNFLKWLAFSLSYNVKITLNISVFAIILLYGGHLVISGKLSIGYLLSFYILVQQFLPRVDYFYFLYADLQYLKASWRRVKEVLNYPAEDRETRPHRKDNVILESDISIKNLSFRYSLQEKKVLSNVSITLKKGVLYPIIGRSGSGKSTFIKILLGLYHPYEGEIRCSHHSFEMLDRYSLWANIAYLGQEPFLFEGMSIYDNIIIGASAVKPAATREEVFLAAKKAQIYDRITSLPQGFDTVVGTGNFQLSGGEKQRIALARIFLKNPFIIVLDEPTSSLDEENSRLVMNAVQKEVKGRIIILCTHQLELLKNSEHLLYFEDGSVHAIHGSRAKVNRIISNFKKTCEG